MGANIEDWAELDPLQFIDRAADTDGELVRAAVTLHPFDRASTVEHRLAHRPWIVDGIGPHFHPHQDEHFHILSGELLVILEGTEHTLHTGEAITLPAGVPHRHWNPADRPARVLIEHRPAGNSDALLETLYTLAQAGRTDENGIPNLLQSMVLQHAYADHAYASDRPVIVQKALARFLAPIGRLVGYSSNYTMDEIDGLANERE